MRVVNLVECRELLIALDNLRTQVLSGGLVGVGLFTSDHWGNEIVTFAGTYLSKPESALKIAMKVSWELTRRADAIEALTASIQP